MSETANFWPQGTVYGTLLNARAELAALGEQVHQPPYQAPPKAPVLYVKPSNTWAPSTGTVQLPASVPLVEVGASAAMVIGAPAWTTGTGPARPGVAGYVLVADLSVPHTSFFRPPVKAKCPDGFLRIGACCVPADVAGDPADFEIEVAVDGQVVHRVAFRDMIRDAQALLTDVASFMALRPGDLLLLGCGAARPLASAGSQLAIRMRGKPAFGSLTATLAQEVVA